MSSLNHLESLIQAMLCPTFYTEDTKEVKLIQTQMSLVFLTDNYAYKVKKPVHLGYLDYTTLEKRQYYCYEELRLNRRLAKNIYLDVIPIYIDEGVVSLRKRGVILDYAVKMRRLPLEKNLDKLLLANAVDSGMMERLALKLAKFHQRAKSNQTISKYGAPGSIKFNIDENRMQTEKYINKTISDFQFIKINLYNERFLQSKLELLEFRMRSGKIRDCHGDLHTAHICFTDGIVIFDCIEFNDRFRYCDVASEIAFLAMDIERYGFYDLSTFFVNKYIDYTEDINMNELMNFYKCYRAYVRGKVESFKYDSPLLSEEERINALNSAQEYFNLAYSYTRKKPILILISGLIGTGKSTLASVLSNKTGFKVLSSDVIRKTIAQIPLTERKHETYNGGIYSEEFTQKTYDMLIVKASDLLNRGQSVILDASFAKRKQREKAYSLTGKLNSEFLLVECTASEQEIQQRLERRRSEVSVSDGRWEIYEVQKKDFDAITEIPHNKHIVVNTEEDTNKIVQQILERV